MSREEIETPQGRERLEHCVFRVPVNDELISMCEVNALGVREEYYASLSQETNGHFEFRESKRTGVSVGAS
ncbi:hypothetical protein BH11GEM2_BH11GEM2_35340 [soil metagenome]